MPDLGCSLHGFTVYHPQADAAAATLKPLFDDKRVTFKRSATFRLVAELGTPHGRRTLE